MTPPPPPLPLGGGFSAGIESIVRGEISWQRVFGHFIVIFVYPVSQSVVIIVVLIVIIIKGRRSECSRPGSITRPWPCRQHVIHTGTCIMVYS